MSASNPRMILTNMRHELRTPLNAIIGYSEMLTEDAEIMHLNAFIPDLRKVLFLGKEMLEIVNETIDTSHTDTNPIDFKLETIETKLENALDKPLNTIFDCSEMLLKRARESDREAFTSDLKKIISACERFRSHINNIANISKPEAPGKGVDYAFANTPGMIEDVVKTLDPFSKKESLSPATHRSSMLVVDDDEMNRDLLSRYLQRQGHNVTVAEHGRQALDQAKKCRFDLILLDVLMPEMNGYQVLKKLKCEDILRDIPVLMISSLEEMDIVVRCIEMGADDYLAKPFNPVLLDARINSCLEKKRLHDLEGEHKRMLEETFGKYVAQEVRDEVLSGRIPLDGELKDVTVLFADLRDFTPLTESTPPKEVVQILNGYFSEMAPAISRHRGSLLRYVGDEIFAVFGAPLPLKDHPRHAVEAALDMRRLLVVVNKRLEGKGHVKLKHGIGIHSGQVVAANIGSPDRLSYDLVGDTVNLASRIQELTKEYDADILISAVTRRFLFDDFPIKKLQPTFVKGIKDSVEIYGVL